MGSGSSVTILCCAPSPWPRCCWPRCGGSSARSGSRRSSATGSSGAWPTFAVLGTGAQPLATIGAGLLAEAIGLRATAFLAPLGGILGALVLFASPVRALRVLPTRDDRTAAEAAAAVEREQPIGA